MSKQVRCRGCKHSVWETLYYNEKPTLQCYRATTLAGRSLPTKPSAYCKHAEHWDTKTKEDK